MADVFSLHDFDELMGDILDEQTCTHDPLDGVLLVPACHEAGVRVYVSVAIFEPPGTGDLKMLCYRCEHEFLRAAILRPTKMEVLPACDETHPVDALYRDGHILVRCQVCQAHFLTIPVAPYVPA
jgi:hypothetical protein